MSRSQAAIDCRLSCRRALQALSSAPALILSCKPAAQKLPAIAKGPFARSAASLRSGHAERPSGHAVTRKIAGA